jgi:prophage regulatory protein
MAEMIGHIKDALLRRQEVERVTGLGRSAIYERMNPKSKQYDPSFPKPVCIGGPADSPTAVRWPSSSVNAWIQSKITASLDKSAQGE